MDSRNEQKLSRKEFLKLSGISGLMLAVPYRQSLETIKEIIESKNRGFQPTGFITQPGTIGTHHNPDFVDVYYEENFQENIKDVKADIEWAKGFWDTAEKSRKRLVSETDRYKAVGNLEHPGVDELSVGSDTDMLGSRGIWLEVEDQNGIVYSSRYSLTKARQNTWRAGLYYYDAHLLDFDLATEDGETIPLKGEFVFNCYPDKIHIEAVIHVEEDYRIRRASLRCNLRDGAKGNKSDRVFRFGNDAIGIINGKWDRQSVEISDSISDVLCEKGTSEQLYLAFIPDSKNDTTEFSTRIASEVGPLDSDAFNISNGVFKGYDAVKGFYRIKNTPGASALNGFNGFYDNPNMYLASDIEIQNDATPRTLYLLHESPAGPIEAGVLTDSYGFPLPVQVQACKNFGGEMEEPVDKGFSETYYPWKLKGGEQARFRSLHLHQNWGNHALRQLSSIRFFQIYYHLSQGVTETTCFSLPTKFGSTPDYDVRAYNLADYRPLSGQTWTNSPQHHHVALQGWLQYKDEQGRWRYPQYKGTKLLSVGPNMAWFVMDYISSDGKVAQEFEFFEMPQGDETRTFMRCRYYFKESVTIKGDMRRNMRLLNKGTFIRELNWDTLAWREPSGKIKTTALTNDGSWSVTGAPLRPANSFFCGYPHLDGNDGMILRKVTGEVNGKRFQDVGVSAIGHKGGKTELMLVPLIEGNSIEAGSFIEFDAILMPYGDDSSSHYQPMEESIRFGLNAEEYANMDWKPTASQQKPELSGPYVKVNHGEKLKDFPSVVKVKDNWAEFELGGGHDRISVIVTGFKSYKIPMLWQGEAFMDPQVVGGDGYQIMKNSDGTYSSVFVVPAWTTRANNEWKTRSEQYMATQAVSEAEISQVNSLNGDVEMQVEGKGKTIIQSPRIWMPAHNEITPGEAVKTATTDGNKVKTVPIKITQYTKAANINIKRYSSEGFEGVVSTSGSLRLECQGLHPTTHYRFRMGRKESKVTSDESGVLEIGISPGQDQAVTCSLL